MKLRVTGKATPAFDAPDKATPIVHQVSVTCIEYNEVMVPDFAGSEALRAYKDGEISSSELLKRINASEFRNAAVFCGWQGVVDVVVFGAEPYGVWYCPRCDSRLRYNRE
jgi:hypothetical protein